MPWPGITCFSLACIRFDDYHQSIDHERWVDVLDRYDERGLRGLIAVVPEYDGEPLSGDVVGYLHALEEKGWELAQHGYRHEDVGQGRGGQLYDERSEFAGLPYDEQARRIGAGRDVLKSHGIEPTTFVPPWHEYDRNTARALAEHGFDCINEGRWPLPRTVEGITLVPTHVPAVTPYSLGVGVVTLVRHPHLDHEPMKAAGAVAGHEDRVRTPSDVVKWWREQSTLGRVVDAAEPLYSVYSHET